MTLVYSIVQRRCDARVEELRAEFGMILADRILEAEAADFLWEARVSERYLGQHTGLDCSGEEGSEDLSRMVILSWLTGKWIIGVCVVDGEGSAVDLLWKQQLGTEIEARSAFGSVH